MPLIILNIVLPVLAMICFVIAWRLSAPTSGKTCETCDHESDRHHELDPLGQWAWCELHKKDIHSEDETCEQWEEMILIWPNNDI